MKKRKKSIKKCDKYDNNRAKREGFLSLYKEKACNISATCDAVGISRETYYRWRRNYPDFDQGCKDAKSALIDLAETQLFKNLREGKEQSLFFFLKSHKRDIYGEKSELQLRGQLEPLIIKIDDGNNPSPKPGKGTKKR